MNETVIDNHLTTYSPLLREMLNRVSDVNFSQFVEIEQEIEGKKLSKHQLVVPIVDELLSIATQNNWGLCKMYDSIYAYNGEYWAKLDIDDFKSFLGDAACLMGIKRIEGKHYQFQEQLYRQFMASAKLNNEVNNPNVTLINLRNGTFEITTKGGRLREFRREDGITYQLPFNYDENATCPMFDDYLRQVLPDQDLRDILAEFLGYVFTKQLKLEKCLLLYGTGANGKSVFFEIVNALLGKENISNFSLGNLAEEHNRALIANKLLNYGSEIKGSINSDTFKQLASGEPIQSRMKYGNSFNMENYARLCFNCNELPSEVEHSEAFFRRFLIIPSQITIPEEHRDPELANDIIYSELSGVFNWVLQGLTRLLFNRSFTYSEVVQNTVAAYKQQSDNVLLFLEEESLQPCTKTYVQTNVIYQLYKRFCLNDGYRPLGKSKFHKRLHNLKYVIERRNCGNVVYISTQKSQEQK